MICSAKLCKNKYIRGKKNISYFKFPKNMTIFIIWAKLIGRRELLPEKYDTGPKLYLCEEHFNKLDFILRFGKKMLKPGSLPQKLILKTHYSPNSVKEIKKPDVESVTVIAMKPTEEEKGLYTNVVSEMQPLVEEGQPHKKSAATVSCVGIFRMPETEIVIQIHQQEGKTSLPASISFKNLEDSTTRSLTFRAFNEDLHLNIDTLPLSLLKTQAWKKWEPKKAKECGSSSAVCAHYVSFIEEKAKNHKLLREMESLREELEIVKRREEKSVANLLEELELRKDKGDYENCLSIEIKDEPPDLGPF